MDFLPKLSLRNRAFIALLAVVMSVVGVFAATNLRQELIPSVELPAVQVTAVAPGTSSEQMAAQIADPIERNVRTLENVESTGSQSRSSSTTVTVNMDYGSDLSRAAGQIDVVLNRLDDSFPEGTTTQVISGGTGQIPALMLAVSSDLETEVLSSRISSAVIPELEKVDGVATVSLLGAPEPIVQLTLDQDAMDAAGVTEGDIVTALDEGAEVLPGGSVADGDRTLDITVGQEYGSVDDIAATPVLPAEGAPVPLSDLAEVERTTAEPTSVSRTDGRDSVMLIVTPTTTGNLVEISEGVTAELDGLAETIGGSTEFVTVFDQAPFIQDSITSLAEEGALGLLFAVLVILVFLLAVRPTIITALSIPLSVLFAFVGMLVTGTTLNMLSLAGLTISIGRLVDDSIVVIENVMRHQRYGKSKGRAIVDATKEVAGAVTSSTVVAMLVFAPLLLVEGMAGELFRPFALTVVLALFASLLVSLTIVPALSYWFLREPLRASAGSGAVGAGAGSAGAGPAGAGPAPAGTEAGTAARPTTPAEREAVAVSAAEEREEKNWLTRLYRPLLRAGLGHKAITLVLALVISGGSAALIPALKVNLLGNTGQNMVSLTQTLPAGTGLEAATAAAAETEEDLGAVEGVEMVQTSIGGGGFMQSAENEISYTLMTDVDQDQQQIRTDVEDTVEAHAAEDPDAGEFEVLDATGLGSSTIDVKITAPDDEALAAANESVLETVAGVDGVESATSDFTAAEPTVQITIDRDAAAQRGMSTEQAVGLIAARTADRAISQVTLDGQQLSVQVAAQGDVETLEDVENLDLGGLGIEEIADVEVVDVAPSISTENAVRTVTVSATPVSSDDVGAVSADVQAAVADAELPDGAVTTMGGISADIQESFTQLGIALLAAILLIYIVLVWIFKSLLQPLLLLVSIPLAAAGSVLALLATGTPLGLPSLIGVLMLVGIVVTNAIVLIDLVNQYRRAGMPIDEAITRGAHHRVRPIVMTAAATIFALLPAAIGITGQQSFISAPLATVTIGGLLSSTLMTLIVLPVLYRLLEGVKERRAERRAERTGIPLHGFSGREHWEDEVAQREQEERLRRAGIDPETGLRAGQRERLVSRDEVEALLAEREEAVARTERRGSDHRGKLSRWFGRRRGPGGG